MATVIRVPALGPAIANITVIKWFVAEGEEIRQGETLLEVDTDKMAMEIPADRSGFLHRIFAPEGTETREDAPLAIVGDFGEDVTALVAEVTAELGMPGEPRPETNKGSALKQEKPGQVVVAVSGKVVATPAARRLAKELGVELQQVPASRGTVTEEDVNLYHAEHAPAQRAGGTSADEDVEVIPLVGSRKVLAEAMAKSVRVAPHYTMVFEIDCQRLLVVRESLQGPFERETGAKLTFLPFVVKAVARAVRDVPIVNATLEDDGIHVRTTAHVGVAVAVGDLIVVPVIRGPIVKSVFEIGGELARLTELARDRRLGRDDLAGGTITISSVGATEIMTATSIINQPQVAIIAVTKIVERAVVVGGAVVVRPRMNAVFTYDHRVVQGVPGANFAERVKAYLEDPDQLDA